MVPKLSDMKGKKPMQPENKIVSLMDLVVAPVKRVVEPKEEEEEDVEEEEDERYTGKTKKHFRPKKELRNVFTRMRGINILCI